MSVPPADLLSANHITLTLLGQGVILGLGAAVPIGPVNVQVARRALREGFSSGFALGCGAVTVDVIYAVVSSLSFAALLSKLLVARVVSIIGVILLLYLAGMCFRAAWQALGVDPIEATTLEGSPQALPRRSSMSAYLTGFLMTLLNPMTLIFWFTVVPGQIPQGLAAGLPTICAGVFIGTISWVIGFSGALAWAGRYRKNWWMAVADTVGGVALLGFAVAGLLRLLRSFL
jgi:threonine/homoserine/homoserine lactone efflux protein